MATRELAAEKLDAEFRKIEARLTALEAESKFREAKEEMAEISGLNAARDRARQKLADVKLQARENVEAARHEVETLLHDLEAGIKRVAERAGERYAAWDAARERGFSARLDEAEAKLKVWNAQKDEWKAEHGMKLHDELARLRERIALGRARLAEWQHARHDRKAQETLEAAARHFDEAYDAAATRYHK
jgi:hypothetical protein